MYAILLKISSWDARVNLDGNFGLIKSIDLHFTDLGEMWNEIDVPKFMKTEFFDSLEDIGLFDWNEISRLNDFYLMSGNDIDLVILKLQLPTGYIIHHIYHFPESLYHEFCNWIMGVQGKQGHELIRGQKIHEFWTTARMAKLRRVV